MNNFYNIENNICTLCPRGCGRRPGFCGESFDLRISRAALHFFEEPCISGLTGSGAIFFTGCNLKCIFCQNNSIANNGPGKVVNIERLCQIFWELKDKGANNINLVTPSHFVPQIARAIKSAKDDGFDLPFIYNSSAYESVDTLKLLDGLIDVYLPDYKYEESILAKNYSNAENYPAIARLALAEMYRQVGSPVFDYDAKNQCDLIKKGMIVRHLVLPAHTKNSIRCLDYLYETYASNIYISIMNQYTPIQGNSLEAYPELKRPLTKREYERIVNHALNIGITNCYIQEGDTMKDTFIPKFDLTGV